MVDEESMNVCTKTINISLPLGLSIDPKYTQPSILWILGYGTINVYYLRLEVRDYLEGESLVLTDTEIFLESSQLNIFYSPKKLEAE